MGEGNAAKFSAEGMTVNGAAYKKAADKPAAGAKPAASAGHARSQFGQARCQRQEVVPR